MQILLDTEDHMPLLTPLDNIVQINCGLTIDLQFLAARVLSSNVVSYVNSEIKNLNSRL